MNMTWAKITISSYNNSFQDFICNRGEHTLIIVNAQGAVDVRERSWNRSEQDTQGNVYILKI